MPGPATLSSMKLARLVQAYLAASGVSIEQKAVRIGVRRNELLRAARGAISRTVRVRLLAFFAPAPAGWAPADPAATSRPHGPQKRGFT